MRDLPKSKLGVDVDNEFAPQYIVPREKKDVVNKIKEDGAHAPTPSTWRQTLTAKARRSPGTSSRPPVSTGRPLQRVVFHEITPGAIQEAFDHPRDIDVALVDAQQARRVLDRLVGYKISPLLWKKVRRGLSAGRVQSAALRMVVDREREILDFTPKEYWSIDADLAKATAPDAADLHGPPAWPASA